MTIFAIGRTVSRWHSPSHPFFIYEFIILPTLQAYKHPEWRGPFLGPKPSEEHKREFTESQLRASEGIIGLQAGTNKGANQSGQNFGATRKILLGKWSVELAEKIDVKFVT